MRRPSPFPLYLLSFFLFAAPLFAQEAGDDPKLQATTRSLATNRLLLTRAEAEYRDALALEEKEPSDELTRKLDNLRYKIQALKDDAQRLTALLPKKVGAGEFLEDVIYREQTLGSAHDAVDPERELKIDRAVKAVIAKHEKALSLVSQNRYIEAEKIYREIILESPDDEEAYLLLGHTALAARHLTVAAEAFANAIHIRRDNMREIPRLYENVLVENPLDDDSTVLLAYCHYLLGDARGAVKFFEDALRINPNNGEALGMLDRLRDQDSFL